MAGIITGRVLDAAGQPVGGATVAITQSDQPHRDIAAITAADGSFRLGGLRPGYYTLQAHSKGQFSNASTALPVQGGATVEIRLGQ